MCGYMFMCFYMNENDMKCFVYETYVTTYAYDVWSVIMTCLNKTVMLCDMLCDAKNIIFLYDYDIWYVMNVELWNEVKWYVMNVKFWNEVCYNEMLFYDMLRMKIYEMKSCYIF